MKLINNTEQTCPHGLGKVLPTSTDVCGRAPHLENIAILGDVFMCNISIKI